MKISFRILSVLVTIEHFGHAMHDPSGARLIRNEVMHGSRATAHLLKGQSASPHKRKNRKTSRMGEPVSYFSRTFFIAAQFTRFTSGICQFPLARSGLESWLEGLNVSYMHRVDDYLSPHHARRH
jgi:hypothetical protein